MKKGIITLLIAANIFPFLSFAAGKKIPAKGAAEKIKFYYSAWLPYWKKEESLEEIKPYLNKFKELSPFSYEVSLSGEIKDKFKIKEDLWQNFLPLAKNAGIKIIPTIAWFNGNEMHKFLSKKANREKQIADIISLAEQNNFDGIDIDYENKKAETGIYFSKFIKSLSGALRKKKRTLVCSVEARTPLHSRLTVIPKDLKYANDYYILGEYCDETRILAYNQKNIDLILNKEKGGDKIYMPVADKKWVEKVIKETKRYIAPQKIMLGIPTFGYEYEITKNGEKYSYEKIKGIKPFVLTALGQYENKFSYYSSLVKIRSVTYKKAMELAGGLGVTPERNSAGELSFIYATSSPLNDGGGCKSLTAICLTSATSTRYVSFTDAVSMSDKIKLAKKYKLRGVIFFKFDGETDPAIWKEF